MDGEIVALDETERRVHRGQRGRGPALACAGQGRDARRARRRARGRVRPDARARGRGHRRVHRRAEGARPPARLMRRPPDIADARAAWWAWRALRTARASLRNGEVRGVRVPAPPPVNASAARAVRRVLRWTGASCLERSLVLQRWLAAHGVARDVIVGTEGSARAASPRTRGSTASRSRRAAATSS